LGAKQRLYTFVPLQRGGKGLKTAVRHGVRPLQQQKQQQSTKARDLVAATAGGRRRQQNTAAGQQLSSDWGWIFKRANYGFCKVSIWAGTPARSIEFDNIFLIKINFSTK
jgi:hypothetical protein